MNNLKIYALGGLDESGKNLYCVEIDDKILVLNCGVKRSDSSQFGVDFVIPDFTYLEENKDRVVAIIVSNIHDDMMDAVPYLLKKVNVPVYISAIGKKMLVPLLKSNNITRYTIRDLPRNGQIKVDGINVETFALSSSTPDSVGVAVETPKGYVVLATQFVIDFDTTTEMFKTNIGKVAEIGQKGVLVAMLEALYADKSGFTAPRHRIADDIRPVIEDAEGRVFITVYGQNYFRTEEIFNVAAEFKKRVYCYDAKHREVLNRFAEDNYYAPPKDVLLTPSHFNNDLDDCIILVTGFGSRVFNGMYKIATGEDESIELRETDTVIIASPVVSGSEKEASAMENELYRDNVHVVKLNSKETLSSHPAAEDLKMVLSLLNPTYFVPVMGYYRNFVEAGNLSLKIGFTPDKVVILDNGQIAEFKEGRLASVSTLIEHIGETLINEENRHDVTSMVLKDREALSTDGVIVIGITLDFKTKRVIAGPDIQSRGVIYVKNSEYLVKNIGKMVVDLIETNVEEGSYNNMETRAEMREQVARYVFRETGKRPMILPAIIEINL